MRVDLFNPRLPFCFNESTSFVINDVMVTLGKGFIDVKEGHYKVSWKGLSALCFISVVRPCDAIRKNESQL